MQLRLGSSGAQRLPAGHQEQVDSPWLSCRITAHEINVSRDQADPGFSQSDTEIEKIPRQKRNKTYRGRIKTTFYRTSPAQPFIQERLTCTQLIFSGTYRSAFSRLYPLLCRTAAGLGGRSWLSFRQCQQLDKAEHF